MSTEAELLRLECALNLLRDPADPDPGGLDGAWVSVFQQAPRWCQGCWSRDKGSRSYPILKCCESPMVLLEKQNLTLSPPLAALTCWLRTQKLYQMPRWWQTCSVWGPLLPGIYIYSLPGWGPIHLPEGQVLSLLLSLWTRLLFLLSGNNPLPDPFPLPPLDSLLLHGQNPSVLSLLSPPSTTHPVLTSSSHAASVHVRGRREIDCNYLNWE